MVSKRFALRIVLMLLFSVTACIIKAQPTLPGISGTTDKGIVLLTWNCQYDGIKEISVLHSADSQNNYSPIGYVKELDKGIQVFADGHPLPGKNFYKLIIVFKSGLKWGSNYCDVYVDKSITGAPSQHLPPNDSLQRLIVTGNSPRPLPSNTTDQSKKKSGGQTRQPGGTMVKPGDKISPKISITFDADTVDINTRPWKENIPVSDHKIKIKISFDDPNLGPHTFITPLYLFTDPENGNININLPDNVNKHRFAIKFFDMQGHIVTEVPKLTAPKIILDKKNFESKGLYKFVLKKDGLELETGYITIN